MSLFIVTIYQELFMEKFSFIRTEEMSRIPLWVGKITWLGN